MYEINREELAIMIASHTCGIAEAIPESRDYDLADRFISLIDSEDN